MVKAAVLWASTLPETSTDQNTRECDPTPLTVTVVVNDAGPAGVPPPPEEVTTWQLLHGVVGTASK